MLPPTTRFFRDERALAGYTAQHNFDRIAGLLGIMPDNLARHLEWRGSTLKEVEDLKELEAEDIERLSAKLKKVQAKKFVKKMATLQGQAEE